MSRIAALRARDGVCSGGFCLTGEAFLRATKNIVEELRVVLGSIIVRFMLIQASGERMKVL